MKKTLKYFLIPEEPNNHKPKALHLSSLLILFLFIACFHLGLSWFMKAKPGILGFASNLTPEKIVSLTNSERQNQGLGTLTINPLLSEAAKQKATTMFTFSCWSHNCDGKTPWWFIKNVNYNYLYAGENLAKDFGDEGSIVKAWLKSPSHRDNILNSKYKEIGVAIVNGILNGEETTLVVQLFGTPAKVSEIGSEAAYAPAAPEQNILSKAVQPQIMNQVIVTKPIISGFAVTKAFYLFLVMLLIAIFTLDEIIIYRNQVVRASGKSFIHLSFFFIILLSILIVFEGKVI